MRRTLLGALLLVVLGTGTYVIGHGDDVAAASTPAPFPRSVSPLPVPEVKGRAPWETPLPGESQMRRLPDVAPTIRPDVETCLVERGRGGFVPSTPTPAPSPSQVPRICRIE